MPNTDTNTIASYTTGTPFSGFGGTADNTTLSNYYYTANLNYPYEIRYGTTPGAEPSPGDTISIFTNASGGGFTYSNDAIYVGNNPGNVLIYQDSGIYNVLGAGLTSAPYSFANTVFCFLSGTHIATPTGEVLVESLKIGDVISTVDGGTRKVLWIGQQKISTVFGSAKNYPVEICISALGDNLPARPLCVSPGHSLLIDGAFPIASALVNGTTVRADSDQGGSYPHATK